MSNHNHNVDLNHTLIKLKDLFLKRPYPSYDLRKKKILTLKHSLKLQEDNLYTSLAQDFGHRSHYDSLLSDFLPTIQFINYTLKKLKKWMKPSKRHSGILLAPSQVSVMYQPLGVIGVIVPWNFPLYLSIPPIVTALAAGNKVMVKMSEFTPQTNKVIREALKELTDDIVFIEGDSEVGKSFSTLPFDHLFFTGSTFVGQKVAIEAAKNLTPVTLELGGKSPAIITDKQVLKHAVKSLVAGKTINAGQVCVAPDYVLLPHHLIDEFIELFKAYFAELNFEKNGIFQMTFQHSPAHFDRAKKVIEDAIAKGAKVHPVKLESKEQMIPPTLVTNVSHEMLLMQEEIFHSILPVIGIQNTEDALGHIRKHDNPLALYLFTHKREDEDFFKNNVVAGGMAINDTLTHVAVDDAPFGGVGPSGIGHYHGIEGFRRLSHAKTIFKAPSFFSKNYFLLKHRQFFFKILKKVL